jgi:hypothetical protein
LITKLTSKYPNLSVLKSAFQTKELNFDDIRMITEILNKSDSKALTGFNSDIERFTKMVSECMPIKGIRWDDIILRFEWSYEVDRIKALIDSRRDLRDEITSQIDRAIHRFPLKFDEKTVKKWLEQVDMRERDHETVSFRSVMKDSEDRLQ